jgi:hypothetical protein
VAGTLARVGGKWGGERGEAGPSPTLKGLVTLEWAGPLRAVLRADPEQNPELLQAAPTWPEDLREVRKNGMHKF